MLAAINACASSVKSVSGGYVCFANVHTMTESTRNQALRSAFLDARFAMADGMPLVWASHLKNKRIDSRVCGPDFMKGFIDQYPKELFGFIGGLPGQGDRIASRFRIAAVSYSNPIRPFTPGNTRDDWANFLKICAEKNHPVPRAIWVGLGAPKQELWMQEVVKIAPGILFFGVGAAFDFLSAEKNRAPVWMQKTGTEWIFRLFQEPSRLWKRYLTTNFEFLYKLIMESLRNQR